MSRRLLALSKAALSVLLVAWLVRALDGAALEGAIRQLAPLSLAAAALLIALQAVVIGWRWHRIVLLLGGRLSLRDALKWVFIGMFFNNALPTSVGGDAVRIWLLRRSGVPLVLSAGSVAVERGTGIVILGLMVSACVPAVWTALDGHSWRLALALIGPTLLVGLLVVAVTDKLTSRWMTGRLAGALSWLGGALRRLAWQPRSLAEITFLGVAASLTGLVAAFVLGQSMSIGLSLPAYIVLVGGSVLLSILPISLGGWGVRELGMVALFSAVGVGEEQALVLSLLWGLLPLLVSLPAGLLWWRGGGKRDGGTDETRALDSAYPPLRPPNPPSDRVSGP